MCARVSVPRADVPGLTRAPEEGFLGSKHKMYLLPHFYHATTLETASNDRPFYAITPRLKTCVICTVLLNYFLILAVFFHSVKHFCILLCTKSTLQIKIQYYRATCNLNS